MRRLLSVLKYVPTVLCGLLVVAWVVSLCFEVDGSWRLLAQSRYLTISIHRACLSIGIFNHPTYWNYRYFGGPETLCNVLGVVSFRRNYVCLPILAMVSCAIPLTIGPFIRFRFPLWSWFVFTALVAVESAYYLR